MSDEPAKLTVWSAVFPLNHVWQTVMYIPWITLSTAAASVFLIVCVQRFQMNPKNVNIILDLANSGHLQGLPL